MRFLKKRKKVPRIKEFRDILNIDTRELFDKPLERRVKLWGISLDFWAETMGEPKTNEDLLIGALTDLDELIIRMLTVAFKEKIGKQASKVQTNSQLMKDYVNRFKVHVVNVINPLAAIGFDMKTPPSR